MKIFPKIIAFAVTIIVTCVSLVGCAEKTSSNVQVDNNGEGKLAITVVDKVSKKPISDAKLVIVGQENSYKTDEKGVSPEITLRANKDMFKKYGEELLKKVPSGFATVLISKEGYKNYLVFNKAIYPGRTANSLEIQLTKENKNDKDNYLVETLYPHHVWIQELIQYCNNIKDENNGKGENALTVNVKDQNSKQMEGAFVTIPELGIKAKTDKTGNVVLKLSTDVDTANIYPVERTAPEYTIVVSKENCMTAIVFNVTISENKAENIVLKPGKSASEYNLSYKPYEKEWIEKVINNYKE